MDDPLLGYFRGTLNRLYLYVTDGNGREFAVADTLGRRSSQEDQVPNLGKWYFAGATKRSNTFDSDRLGSAQAPGLSFFRNRAYDQASGRNYSAVRYANSTTGLKVAVDWSELRPFLTIYELTTGVFPPEPAAVGIPGGRRQAFEVDDLLLVRPPAASPVGKMVASRDDHAAMQLVADYARSLEQQASDVLSGDFAVFDQLDQIVTKREQSLRKARR